MDEQSIGGGGALDTLMPYLMQARMLGSMTGSEMPASGTMSLAMQLMNMEQTGGLSAREQETAQKQKVAANMLKDLQSSYSSAGGASGRVGGFFKNILGDIGADSESKAYENVRASVGSRLARAMGESGSLSGPDIERILMAIPKLTSTGTEADLQWDFLTKQIAGGVLPSSEPQGGMGPMSSNYNL